MGEVYWSRAVDFNRIARDAQAICDDLKRGNQVTVDDPFLAHVAANLAKSMGLRVKTTPVVVAYHMELLGEDGDDADGPESTG